MEQPWASPRLRGFWLALALSLMNGVFILAVNHRTYSRNMARKPIIHKLYKYSIHKRYVTKNTTLMNRSNPMFRINHRSEIYL